MVIYVLRSKVFLQKCAKLMDSELDFEDSLFDGLFLKVHEEIVDPKENINENQIDR